MPWEAAKASRTGPGRAKRLAPRYSQYRTGAAQAGELGPGVPLHAPGQRRRAGGLHAGTRAHRCLAMLAVHVEKVADVAESVAHRRRFGRRRDVEAEFGQALALLVARAEAQQHHAPAHRLRVAEHGKMLHFEVPAHGHVHGRGESSTA